MQKLDSETISTECWKDRLQQHWNKDYFVFVFLFPHLPILFQPFYLFSLQYLFIYFTFNKIHFYSYTLKFVYSPIIYFMNETQSVEELLMNRGVGNHFQCFTLFLFYVRNTHVPNRNLDFQNKIYLYFGRKKKKEETTNKCFLRYSREVSVWSPDNMVQSPNDTLSAGHQTKISRCLFGLRPKSCV